MRALPTWIRSVGPLALADLRRRYAGSVLGGLWAIATPLVEVAAYAVVFGLFLGPAGGSGLSHALFIASGLLPWAALRESLETSASTLPDNRWIRRSRVPMELLVGRHVLVASARAAVALVLVLGVSAVSGRGGIASFAFPFLALALQVTACYGAGLAVAPLATLHPDLRPALSSALTLLTFASPILYPESLLGPRALALVEWNPFTHVLRLYRSPLTGLPTVGVGDVAWVAITSFALVALGAAVKHRLWWGARDRL
jgi:lipopolysaccharide transport system permease protein